MVSLLLRKGRLGDTAPRTVTSTACWTALGMGSVSFVRSPWPSTGTSSKGSLLGSELGGWREQVKAPAADGAGGCRSFQKEPAAGQRRGGGAERRPGLGTERRAQKEPCVYGKVVLSKGPGPFGGQQAVLSANGLETQASTCQRGTPGPGLTLSVKIHAKGTPDLHVRLTTVTRQQENGGELHATGFGENFLGTAAKHRPQEQSHSKWGGSDSGLLCVGGNQQPVGGKAPARRGRACSPLLRHAGGPYADYIPKSPPTQQQKSKEPD